MIIYNRTEYTKLTNNQYKKEKCRLQLELLKLQNMLQHICSSLTAERCVMASLYQRKNGIYYLSVVFQGSRSTKSLETKSEETAKAITPYVERQLLDQLINDILFENVLA